MTLLMLWRRLSVAARVCDNKGVKEKIMVVLVSLLVGFLFIVFPRGMKSETILYSPSGSNCLICSAIPRDAKQIDLNVLSRGVPFISSKIYRSSDASYPKTTEPNYAKGAADFASGFILSMVVIFVLRKLRK